MSGKSKGCSSSSSQGAVGGVLEWPGHTWRRLTSYKYVPSDAISKGVKEFIDEGLVPLNKQDPFSEAEGRWVIELFVYTRRCELS
jgi:hypothetical protein